MDKQSSLSQKGEVTFRRKLYLQQVEGQNEFNDEYNATAIEEILKTRMVATLEQISGLKQRGITISPYLEIGAGRGRRSLILENDLNSKGIIADLSFDMLKSANHYAKVFNKPNIPFRVCCDVNNLPFKTGSIPFVFCYDTLHHFPDPTPIVAEVHRVMTPGAHFFFGQEPFKKILHLDLYKSDKAYSEKYLKSSKLKKIINFFLAERVGNENDFNVIENEKITIKKWKKIFSAFNDQAIKLVSLGKIETKIFGQKNYLKYLLNFLLGGNISGTVKKPGSTDKEIATLDNFLICPDCLKNKQEKQLEKRDNSWVCPHCQQKFPIFEGVTFLLENEKFKELYPEIYQKTL